MAKRLVTVFGATGNQGGAVVSTLLSNPTLSQQFSVRAVTRNTSSPKAQSLASKGVDLKSADMNDPQSVSEAVKGSYAVFAVTNYWESASREVEVSQGKAIADACASADVKHLVWSALPNVTELTGGALKKVEHFESKHDVAMYIENIKKSGSMIATYFMPGFYMSNLKSMTRSSPQVNDGTPTISLPWDAENTKVALFDAAQDTGTFVGGILGYPNPAELDGQFIQAVSEWATPTKIVADMSEVIGREVKFNPLSEEASLKAFGQGMPQKIAEELVENMVLIRDFSYYGKGTEKKQAESNKVLEPLDLKTQTFKEWVKKAEPWEF